MKQIASINDSANSHVTVTVDTRPMAYAMLSCLYATGRFNDNEINDMVSAFEDMGEGNKTRYYKGKNDPSHAKLF
ncbi:hypothetical protein EV207_15822 [Scopulibacillus darangshiensis]|uniref:Uncharacterized protein n=1 Tax=Scopulibacillus darangshiensis TaxID=442528 RepID=A0A4R2NF99_9BACL|nr:hypothetical protein [Scopulibacillus darangshiensis]TCP19764.1 hypothetical protein EV207_15822 [Scopulibacillus darangshiensis]